jgi:hypothetical protein
MGMLAVVNFELRPRDPVSGLPVDRFHQVSQRPYGKPRFLRL